MITNVHEWSAKGNCLGRPVLEFFDAYEASIEGDGKLAHEVDARCSKCKVQAKCMAFAVSNKETGVWGGVYFDGGTISKRFNKHKTKEDWANIFLNLVTE